MQENRHVRARVSRHLPARRGYDASYRKLTGDFVSASSFEGAPIVKIDPQALTLLAQQAFVDCQHLLRPGSSAAAPRHPRRPRGLGQRPLRRLRSPEERQYRGRQDPADVPGHRHRHRPRQEGAARLDRRRRCRGARRRHPQDLYRDQSALQPGGAARHVRGGQYRRQSAGADRPLCRGGRRVQIPLHRQGRRLGQQDPFSSSRRQRC